MQQSHLRQQMHSEQPHARKLGAKSRRWMILLPVLGWVMVLAAVAAAFVGSGQFPWTSAHGAGAVGGTSGTSGTSGGTNYQSEAALGSQFGQWRQSGCALIVPQHPLTAQGLATPYQLTGSDVGGSPCHETDRGTAAFVQAAVLDPATGQISIYNPLVIDLGTQPAAAPVVPKLPANAVVGIWFGSNGSVLRLRGATFTTLLEGQCVDGLGSSAFGQVSYCHAPAFFAAANRQIQMKKLTPPALGTGTDGMTCPTVRDFSVVDQDQSDNVTTSYRITQDGKLAQDTAAMASQFPVSSVLANGSDNRLVAIAMDSALGCTPWKAPNLADPGQMVTAQPLNELQAAMYQAAPVALVPSGDPMTLVNGKPNLLKQNLYRIGVDQPWVRSTAEATAQNRAYCQHLMSDAPKRIQQDQAWTESASSLDSGVANSLYTFLAARLSVTIGPDELNCTGLLQQSSPIQLVQNSDGVVVDVTFTTPTPAQQAQAGA